MLVKTFSTEKNQSQFRPKIQIIIYRAEMTVKSAHLQNNFRRQHEKIIKNLKILKQFEHTS
jgi:hypothetical protein